MNRSAIAIAIGLSVIGCRREHPPGAQAQVFPGPASVCGSKIIEPLGTMGPSQSATAVIAGFDPNKKDVVNVSYTSGAANVWTPSTGASDPVFSYVLTGSTITLTNHTASAKDWYAAALVHDCY